MYEFYIKKGFHKTSKKLQPDVLILLVAHYWTTITLIEEWLKKILPLLKRAVTIFEKYIKDSHHNSVL